MPRPLTLDDVLVALQQPLPGPKAQSRMATRPRALPEEFAHSQPPRTGAVLILLYPHAGQLHLPLTRRTQRVANHKGQISLPGGGQEEGDASLWATALREAAEEIGIHPEEVRYLGALTPLYIPPSNFDIHPFVGYTPARPRFSLAQEEVAELIELPLEVLLDPQSKAEETWVWRDRPMQVPFYRYQGHVIWGATAMVLSELEALLQSSRP
jgi:8-oxo-dGTP pyrophosphatase MutT (NUDIX family)